MSSDFSSPEHEYHRQELERKVLELLKQPNVRLKDLAEFLNAEDCLSKEQAPRKGITPAYIFDVQKFVARELGALHPLALPDGFETTDTVIIPPDPEGGVIEQGSGAGVEKKNSIPRTTYLRELLTEMKLRHTVLTGAVTDTMMRGESYIVFSIPDLKKLVFVNNEEGNRTFIVHNVENPTDFTTFSNYSKDELKSLAGEGVVSHIIWPGDSEEWKMLLRDLLISPPAPQLSSIDPRQTPIERGVLPAPVGWMLNLGLARELGVAEITIKKFADSHRKDHPEWFKKYLDSGRHEREYYHPDLVIIIQEYIKGREPAPEGWTVKERLAKDLHTDVIKIAYIGDFYLKDHPEWSKKYLDRAKRLTYHYHPDLVALIRKEIKGREPAPEGWVTPEGIAKELKVDTEAITNVADHYRKDHPNWFKRYLDKIRRRVEHYHPELVSIIFEEIKNNRPLIPEGWVTPEGIAKELNVDTQVITKIADPHRRRRKWLFREYVDRSTRKVEEYYNPILIDLIYEEVLRRRSSKTT